MSGVFASLSMFIFGIGITCVGVLVEICDFDYDYEIC